MASKMSTASRRWSVVVATMLLTSALGVREVAATEVAPQAPAKPASANTTMTFAFWNVENLFDTDDDATNKGDDEFLPATDWTAERYQRKLQHLAEVILAFSPHVLGVAEIENRRVLEDLLATPALKPLGYRIVHRDSPDKRGIDVALIYRAPLEFVGNESSVVVHRVEMESPTRGVLEVPLVVADTRLTILVNHWPSRTSGTQESAPLRAAAARACRAAVERIVAREAGLTPGRDADVIVMGDFNDDPFDASVLEVLGAEFSRNKTLNYRDKMVLYNPSWSLCATPDQGTLYYNKDWRWNVFDQAILTKGLLDDVGFRFVEGSLAIHATDKMRDKYRRPLRFKKQGKAGEWIEGYSDHFPIYGKLELLPATAKAVPAAAGAPDPKE
ncbi:MAG: endonuclease/exonuclease/phosphatase family protein [Planctomycetota bacterium]